MEDLYDSTINIDKEKSILQAKKLLKNELCATKQNIIRPDINTARSIVKILFWLIFSVLITVLSILFFIKKNYFIFFFTVTFLICFFLFSTKQIIKTSIVLYQKIAPQKLRESCLFEPSCSQYMLIAIEKYGLIHGVYKGIKRVLRCHNPNGGIDYP